MWKDVKSDPVDGRVRTKLHNGPVWLRGWENHDCATDLLQPSSRVVTGAAALRHYRTLAYLQEGDIQVPPKSPLQPTSHQKQNPE